MFERKKNNNLNVFIFFLILFFSSLLIFKYNLLGFKRLTLMFLLKFKNTILFFCQKKIKLINYISYLKKENNFLKKKIYFMNNKMFNLNNLKIENIILRKTLLIPNIKKQKFIFSKILFNNFYNNQIVTDKGKDYLVNNKIYYVINNDGFIGNILNIDKFTSRVQLICDYKSNISVQVLRNNLRFILYGNGCLNNLKSNDLPVNADIVLGDILVTSSINGFYSSGYPVAIVTKILIKKNSFKKDIEAKPFVNFNNINYVLILSNY